VVQGKRESSVGWSVDHGVSDSSLLSVCLGLKKSDLVSDVSGFSSFHGKRRGCGDVRL